MNARQLHIGDIGGIGIFNLLAEGLSFRSREPDMFEIAGRAPVESPHRTVVGKIDDWFWRRHQRSVEMRLARAADIFELERMIRAMERGDISAHE